MASLLLVAMPGAPSSFLLMLPDIPEQVRNTFGGAQIESSCTGLYRAFREDPSKSLGTSGCCQILSFNRIEKK